MIATPPLPADALQAVAEAARATAAVLRPPPEQSPSEFAAAHRRLKPGTTFKAGPWDNAVFPFLEPVMDAVEEALRTGRNLCLMKAGQLGGSEAIINVLLWLRVHLGGPHLYMTSKEVYAEEFGLERFGWADKTCEPIAKLAITGYGTGANTQRRFYLNGSLRLVGGRAASNLETKPYNVVVIDEADSIMQEFPTGDPFALAENRTDAFPGRTLIIAFAHPTVRSRGVAKLYYGQSDQRRGFVSCPHCPDDLWLSWEHVRVEPVEGEKLEVAQYNPDRYVYRTPCCNGVLTDAQRWAAVAAGVEQRSTLPDEEAATKRWVGVHISHLYSTKPLRGLAQRHIEGTDDPAKAKVFANKVQGEPSDESEGGADASAWERCKLYPGSGDAFLRGTVPNWATFLTSGHDYNAQHLHGMVWAWGMRLSVAGLRFLFGQLVEWYEIERRERSPDLNASELRVWESLIYAKRWARPNGTQTKVHASFHDSGWQPDAVYQHCHTRDKATPAKGGAYSARTVAPIVKWGTVPAFVVDGQTVAAGGKLAILNTYDAKLTLYSLVTKRQELTGQSYAHRLAVPYDTPPSVLVQLGAEKLVDGVWVASGPNHFGDCAVYAYAAAQSLHHLHGGQTAEELRNAAPKPRSRAGGRGRRRKPLRRGY